MTYFWEHRSELEVSLNEFYKSINITKQGLHQYLNRQMHYNEETIYVKQILEQIRQDHPTLSCRAIYYKVNPVSIGRDKFERMCKEMGFTIERHINPCRTTNSNGVIRFDNLLIGIEITSINQVKKSD